MTTRIIGKVIKSVGGYHTVLFPDGKELLLRARGIVKRVGTILVGDEVEVRLDGSGGGVVERIFERKSELVRPPIANVDLVLVVFALDKPAPVLDLLDRILAQAEQQRLAAVVVLNKCDLVHEEAANILAKPYRQAGYEVVFTSTHTGRGLDLLEKAIGPRLAVMAGPSGVGKTSLLNELIEDIALETQAVSEKTKRGRHTTREVSILSLKSGGWIADTPGFSTLNFGIVDPREVPMWYPEFASLSGECRFQGCLHRSEPGCRVQQGVANQLIDRGRYERYLNLLTEIEEAFERRYS